MVKKYQAERKHHKYVTELTQQLFDLLQPLHKLDQNDLELVALAANLHDLGHFIGKKEHHEHSRYIIMNDPLLNDMEERARQTLGLIVLNHRKPTPLEVDPEDSRIKSLIAILRIADVLDYEHKQKVRINHVYYNTEQQTLLLDIKWKSIMKYQKKVEEKLQWAADVWQVAVIVKTKKEQLIVSPFYK
ncbi:HD domain-containing protein [Ammoniphilus sp. YIM 78166]|uniref:HD domain-containing protein n=1 Tax=Ammoniphilus sp. YIM 78166 TaxID=1644106 RepID=UPI001F0E5908|nr:HD domain-containing protein [Ammoniphilus sp. YIM 78166]